MFRYLISAMLIASFLTFPTSSAKAGNREAAAAALVGTSVDAAAIGAAIAAMQDAIDPTEDNRGPIDFKRHAAGVILGRAIARAWSRA